ncbi:MAG: S8 family serine peptidase [Nitrososphaerales archaeon]
MSSRVVLSALLSISLFLASTASVPATSHIVEAEDFPDQHRVVFGDSVSNPGERTAADRSRSAPTPIDYIVGFKKLPEESTAGVYQGEKIKGINKDINFIVVEVRNPKAFEHKARSDQGVRYFHQDLLALHIMLSPTDPKWSQQYGPQSINAPAAWDTTIGDTSAIIAIVDTGVQCNHEDLERCMQGKDFVNNDKKANDDHGHGTHVAGTAAATINNAKGIAGMAQGKILPVKVLNSKGSGTWSQVANGITFAANKGATVINLSLGGSSGSTALQDAVNYALGKGSLVVAAAGNSGPCSDCIIYPAAYSGVIAVTCTDQTDKQCSFSSSGPEADLAAPGYSILSTYIGNSYKQMSGTSMSTPHVSGVAALIKSALFPSDPTNSRMIEIRDKLITTATDLGAKGHDEIFGHGLVNAFDAVQGGTGNKLPTADFTWSSASLDVSFDASTSSDPDGTIVSYDWTFGDGATGTGKQITHTYPKDTVYEATLKVTDDKGGSSTVKKLVSAGTPGNFAEDFNSGQAIGWTFNGLWHVGKCYVNSPQYSLEYNKASTCSYDTGSTNFGDATFGVDLTGISDATLSFQHRYETEQVASPTPYDSRDVQISVDVGGSWTTLKHWDANDPNQLSWKQESIDLTPYVGSIVLVGFHFDTVDSLYNNYDGWSIDDVQVTSSSSPAPPPPSPPPPSGTTIHVHSIDQSKYGNDGVKATVTINDQDEVAVSGASVCVTITKQAKGKQQQQKSISECKNTDSNGEATFTWVNPGLPGNFETCVVSVSHSNTDYQYDPNSNHVTCVKQRIK